jgi:hypothetical protein
MRKTHKVKYPHPQTRSAMHMQVSRRQFLKVAGVTICGAAAYTIPGLSCGFSDIDASFTQCSQLENPGDDLRTDGHIHVPALFLKKSKAFWNMFLLLINLVYNLAIPAPSLADFAPAAVGHPYFGSGIDSDRVNAPLANSTTAACPKTSCVYLPWLISPMPVRLVDVGHHSTKFDTYQVFGDLTTLYEYPVYNVSIKFRVYDAVGQLLGEYLGSTMFPATLSGQLNPFDFKTNIPESLPVAREEVIIAGFDLYSPIVYAPATVITTTEVQDYGTTVYARIRNDGTMPLTNVQAIAWSTLGWYDPWEDNHLEKVADSLLPGEEITFTQLLYNNGIPSSIRVAAQGILQP